MNIQELKSRLLPPGQTIKVIKGKAYLYDQSGSLAKLIGPATETQVKDFKRASRIRWLLKNEARFVESLKLLQELRSDN
jgi:hypothetical protein